MLNVEFLNLLAAVDGGSGAGPGPDQALDANWPLLWRILLSRVSYFKTCRSSEPQTLPTVTKIRSS